MESSLAGAEEARGPFGPFLARGLTGMAGSGAMWSVPGPVTTPTTDAAPPATVELMSP